MTFSFTLKYQEPAAIGILMDGVMETGIIAAAEQAGELILSDLENFPFKHPSGNFKRSLYMETSGNVVTIGSDAPYAELLETGASPHVIYPRSASVLVFDGNSVGEASQSNNGLVFTKVVHHPGMPNPPRPFTTTIQRLQGEIDAIFGAVLTNATTGGFGNVANTFQRGSRAGQTYYRSSQTGRFAKGA